MIHIEYDRADLTYYSGEKVSGKVHVNVEKRTKCNSILVRLMWYAHGIGNESVNKIIEINVHDGADLEAGRYTFPFEFQLPAGPCTYRGYHTNVDWYVEAQVDIPWARDPKGDEDFILKPGPMANPPVPEKPHTETKSDNGVTGGIIGVGMLFVAAICFLIDIATEEFGLSCCGLICLIGGGFVTYMAVHRFLSTRLVGAVTFGVEPWPVHPGGTFTHRIEFTPKADMLVNEITVQLEGKEVVVEGAGSDKTTYTHELFNQTITVCGESECAKGGPVVFNADFEIPADAACSFECSSNQVVWLVTTHIDIPNWPDWNDTHEVVVAPDHTPRAMAPETSAPGPVW